MTKRTYRSWSRLLGVSLALGAGMMAGVEAQENPDLDTRIEELIDKKLAERESQGQSDIFSQATGDLGVEIHGHLQFEHENYESEGSRSGDSTFDNQYFTLWIGKQITEDLRAVIEIEYEHGGTDSQTGGTGGGGGGQTEIDQAMAVWNPGGYDEFGIKIGKFYVPFGIERFSYAGPQNRLVSRPAPFQRIWPGTYADNGVAIQGRVGDDVAFIYELAAVNGLGPAAATSIRTARQGRDNEDNKAMVGRIAVAFGDEFEFGTSYYEGKYNEFQVLGHALAPDSEFDLIYNGIDARMTLGQLDVRGEWIESSVETGETLTNGFRNFRRQGYYIQTAWRQEVGLEFLDYLDGVVRFDSKDENTTVKDTADTNTWALGVTFGVNEHLKFKVERQMVHERGPVKLDNDAWLMQASVQF